MKKHFGAGWSRFSPTRKKDKIKNAGKGGVAQFYV